jgi:hypothetical protein
MSILKVDTINEKTSGNGVAIPGHIIQMVNTSWSTQTAITSQSATAITGASLAITPKFSTSKILVMVNLSLRIKDPDTSYANCGLEILRGSTQLQTIAGDNSGPFEIGIYDVGGGGGELNSRYANNIVDSPSTTSATTYSVKGKIYSTTGPTLTINQGDTTNGQSSIILLEIAQ